jgi:hypothetical protein
LYSWYSRGTAISGSLPSEWSALTKLKYVEMSEMQLTGAVNGCSYDDLRPLPGHESKLKPPLVARPLCITTYSLLITGTLPDSWSTMTALKRLYLSKNAVTGVISSAGSLCRCQLMASRCMQHAACWRSR